MSGVLSVRVRGKPAARRCLEVGSNRSRDREGAVCEKRSLTVAARKERRQSPQSGDAHGPGFDELVFPVRGHIPPLPCQLTLGRGRLPAEANPRRCGFLSTYWQTSSVTFRSRFPPLPRSTLAKKGDSCQRQTEGRNGAGPSLRPTHVRAARGCQAGLTIRHPT